jgi:hypothetical protein
MAKVNLCKLHIVFIAMIVDDTIADKILARYNISWPVELPTKLKTITREDYEKTIERIVQFSEASERGEKAELILKNCDLNYLRQPFYEGYSNLSTSNKVMTHFDIYDIQNNIIIQENTKKFGLMSLLQIEKYFYNKTKIQIVLEAGVIQEKLTPSIIFNQELGDFTCINKNLNHGYDANNLIQFILVSPYKKSIKQLNSSERYKFENTITNLKSIEVNNDTLFIRT